MSSAAIVTLRGNQNYGNRLQNFALQECLKSMGVEQVVTIVPPEADEAFSRSLEYARMIAIMGPLEVAKKVQSRWRQHVEPAPEYWRLRPACTEAISDFISSRIAEAPAGNSLGELRASSSAFDAVIVGSDQVWAPKMLPRHVQFLEFAPEGKRIAYAASFGVSSVPRHYLREFRRGIREMTHVSVREERGAELVREIGGRVAPVVLDPTMLLASDAWSKLAAIPPVLCDRGYVASFFLGHADPSTLDPIRLHASRTDLELIDLKTCEDLGAMGPLEFIGAIKNARILVTDSFHAAVFATIFETPLLLKGRGATNSRFDTLLSKSGLGWPKWSTALEVEESIDVDWESVRANIARERVKSLGFLERALACAGAK